MRRRALLAGLAATAALARGARARPPAGGALRVGILDLGVPHLFAEFFEAMRELGYVEGAGVSYLTRSADGRPDRIAALAPELVALQPDVIVTTGPVAMRAIMQATASIPIVFAALGDAMALGVVKSLAHPGGNATGLSFLNTEISPKRLHLLLELAPAARRIAVLWDRNSTAGNLEATTDAARPLGIELDVLGVTTPDDFADAFAAAQARQARAINVLASPLFNAHRARLVALAAAHRLPAVYETGEYVRGGGLIAYGPSLPDLFRRAATYVDKIANGAKPADLPVEQPIRFELVVNLKTAKALDLAIPPTLLARADEVIE